MDSRFKIKKITVEHIQCPRCKNWYSTPQEAVACDEDCWHEEKTNKCKHKDPTYSVYSSEETLYVDKDCEECETELERYTLDINDKTGKQLFDYVKSKIRTKHVSKL